MNFLIITFLKAYAKVCGSYENMEGGFPSDALIDMSGGIEETFQLKKNDGQASKDNLWMILVKSRQFKSMNAAFLEPDPYEPEKKLPNGLIKGHAYTITRIALIEARNKEFKLIRVRNPWGIFTHFCLKTSILPYFLKIIHRSNRMERSLV
jgi:hypothetical protein